MELAANDAIRLRLAAHGLTSPVPGGPVAVADRAGALQGQDQRAVVDALAIRAGVPVDVVTAAFGAPGLVRSWPMRGTLFATTPRRLGQFLSVTAPRLATEMTRRRASLGITDDMLDRASTVAAAVLADGPQPRSVVTDAWESAGVQVAGGQGYHLTVTLALRGEVVWGPFVAGDHQLAATSPEDLGIPAATADPDGTIESLVHAYVVGHGPVGADEAAWWMKVPKTPVRAAVERLRHRGDAGVVDVTVDGVAQIVAAEALEGLGDLEPHDPDEVRLLPRFDEWTLGYQERGLVASPAMVEAIDPKRNGQFRRLVTVGGRVKATWERDRQRQPVLGDVIETVTAAQRRAIGHALDATALA